MEVDFPAAHSMDSSWYAVDKDGFVAYFDTGEDGPMPNRCYSPEMGDHFEDMDVDDLEEMGLSRSDIIDPSHLPDPKRLYSYSASDEYGVGGRYQRESCPKKPLHIDELPPDVREALGQARFDTLAFAQTEYLQPMELTESTSWGPAYMSSDGKTIRPVAGREKEYKELMKEIADDFPGVTIEEPAAKKPRASSPKKKKD